MSATESTRNAIDSDECELFDRLPLPAVRLQPGGRAVPLNAAARGIFAVERDAEVDLRRLCLGAGVDPCPEILGALSRGGGWRGEIRWQTDAGEDIWTRGWAEALPDGAALLVLEEVDPQTDLRVRLAEADRYLSVGRMASGIAHNLNNSMVGVLGYASMLKGFVSGEERLSRYVEKIEQSARRAAELIQQFHGLCQPSDPRPVLLNLSDVGEIAAKLFIKSDPRRLSLLYDVDPNVPLLYANAIEVHQAVNALFLYFHRAAEGGPANLRLVVRRATPGELAGNPAGVEEAVCVEVSSDAAPAGIRLGEPLSDRLDVVDDAAGPSLGLEYVRACVEGLHGWSRTGDDGEGRGLIRLYLPSRASLEARRRAQEASSDPPPGARPAPGRIRVLVVDDEQIVRDLACDLLSGEGLDVTTAECGAVGLRMACEDDRLDVLVLDQSMPDMEGFEVYRRLRRERADLPVVVASGYNIDDIRRDFDCGGPVYFVQKPFRPSELVRAINEAVGPSASA